MSITHEIIGTGHEAFGPPDPKALFSRLAAFSGASSPGRDRGVVARGVRGCATGTDVDAHVVGCRLGGAGLDGATRPRRDQA